MMELKIDKKTGFRIVSKPVKILDFRGVVFYDTKDYPNVQNFNLPPGNYTLEKGTIKALEKPIDYPMKVTGKIERKFKWPLHFNIAAKDNPNKATVDWVFKDIEFDKHLMQTWPMPKLFFLYYHELGHARYVNETKVDRFAYNCMIKEGYNPEQIASSVIEALSDKQEERISDAFYSTMKINNYEGY